MFSPSPLKAFWRICGYLPEAYIQFYNVFPVQDTREFERLFKSELFKNCFNVNLFYGDIKCCEFSKHMLEHITSKLCSLRQLCILRMITLPTPILSLEYVLYLERTVFYDFFRYNFLIYWLPMTHRLYHIDATDKENLEKIYMLLANLKLFSRMLNECKHFLTYIFSWMQHSHLYSTFSDSDNELNDIPTVGGEDEFKPLVPPHGLSVRLLRNLEEMLLVLQQRTSEDNYEDTREYQEAAVLGLRMSEFLLESSDYQYAFLTAQAVHRFVHSCWAYSHRKALTVNISMEYYALSLMLRALNSHNMYMEPESRLIFCETAPRLLRKLKRLKLVLPHNSPTDIEELLLSKLSSELNTPALDAEPFVVCPSGDMQTSFQTDPLSPISINEFFARSPSISSSMHNRSWTTLPIPNTDSLCDSLEVDLEDGSSICTAALHAQLAVFCYAMCSYKLAYHYTLLAINQVFLHASALPPGMQIRPQVLIEVLRIASRMCIIKRKCDLGERIIRYTLAYTNKHFGRQSLIYANILLEYGSLLLNTDKIRKAADIYKMSLAIIVDRLPGSSLIAALAIEDVAYSYYVLQYSTGHFDGALDIAEYASIVLNRLNMEVCIQATSTKRVTALIIEEMAIDDNDPDTVQRLLLKARRLHMQSMDLCRRTYGLWNIQTAKHFGNLGRLFQSMQLNEEAEAMHLRAIMIKERLLGPHDFEVGLSVGHLASLYNYDMGRFMEAEHLYLRSIQISLNLFGPSYSGLEYDYRGLQRIYRIVDNQQKFMEYHRMFEEWQHQRYMLLSLESDEYEPIESAISQYEGVSFAEVIDDYPTEFMAVFGGLDELTANQEHSSQMPEKDDSSFFCSSENSRSTGY